MNEKVALFKNLTETKCMLGKGGFGEVYASFYKTLEIAIKHLNIINNGKINEVTVLKLIKSPKISCFYGISNDIYGNLCLILEKIKGFDISQSINYSFFFKKELKEYISYSNNHNFNYFNYDNFINISKNKEDLEKLFEHKTLKPIFELNDLIRIKFSVDMADSLVIIHNNDIIHRDIKPSNFMVDIKIMKVKLLDFGISIISQKTVENSQPRTGTILYYSPEHFQYKQNENEDFSVYISKKSDVWSFGLVLNEFFSGDFPWGNKGISKLNPYAVLSLLSKKEKFIPSEKILLPEIKNLILNCTIIEKENRYNSEQVYFHLIFTLYLQLSNIGKNVKEYIKELILQRQEIPCKSSKFLIQNFYSFQKFLST